MLAIGATTSHYPMHFHPTTRFESTAATTIAKTTLPIVHQSSLRNSLCSMDTNKSNQLPPLALTLNDVVKASRQQPRSIAQNIEPSTDNAPRALVIALAKGQPSSPPSSKPFLLTRRDSEPMTRSPTSTMILEPMVLPPSAPSIPTKSIAHVETSVASKRRLIFASFWESSRNVTLESSSNSGTPTPRENGDGLPSSPPLRHRRSNSLVSAPHNDCSRPQQQQRRCSVGPSIPVSHDGRTSLSDDQQRWQRVSDWHRRDTTYMWRVQQHLPSLPSPLQRLRKHHGVYPLVQPTSILRNCHDHSRRTSISSGDATVMVVNSDMTRTVLKDALRYSMTKLPSCHANPISGGLREDSFDSTASASSFSETSSRSSTPTSLSSAAAAVARTNTMRKVVHFDPRITVTELADRDHVRKWYTDTELEDFRVETIELARVYLCQHPEQITYYRDTFLDPITRTRRHRPLFGLPALRDVDPDDDENDKLQKQQQCRLLESLATFNGEMITASERSSGNSNNLLRRILVLDSNARILDLMHRSVRTMCEHASCCATGVDALEIHCVSTQTEALQLLQGQHQEPFDVVICEQPNLTSISNNDDLIRWIIKSNHTLLIAVSMKPNDPATLSMLNAAGFDFVWGKPPPRMDSSLHAQLVQALRRKRTPRS